AASCFDRCARAFGSTNTLEGDGTTNVAGQHDFHATHVLADDVGILQALHGNNVTVDLGQFGRTHFCAIHGLERGEAEFRQTTMQRLLATLEARRDGAAGTGGLTFVATATGLAEAATDTATRAILLRTGARSRAQIIQVHD